MCVFKRENENTYASARSKLSLTTPVTFRIISKLSVASVSIRCAATIADPSDTPTFSLSPSKPPLRSGREILGDELGEGALELGEDLNPLSEPAPRSLCAVLLCPLLTAAPVPEAASATVPPALVTPISRSIAVEAEAA